MYRTFALATLLAASVSAAPAVAQASSPAPKKALPPIYDTEIQGSLELQSKAKVCNESGRRMLVNFGTNDCDACRTYNRVITEAKFYDALIKQFVPVSIDVSPGSKNRELLKNFQIDPAKGLPAILILDQDSRTLEATRDGEMAAAAKKGDEAVRDWILKRFMADNPQQ